MGFSDLSRRSRGNALVLAVLILLALTSAGVVAVYRTNMDLMVAGNVVRGMQARTAGEAGTQHGVQLVGGNPMKYTKDLNVQRNLFMGMSIVDTGGVQASDTMSQRIFGYSSAVPDPAGVNRPEHLPTVNGDVSLARTRQDIAYDLLVVYLSQTEGRPGYAQGLMCHNEFDFNARGGIPTGLEEVTETLPDMSDLLPDWKGKVTNTVVVENRARAVAGPVKCVFGGSR